jgi:transcriptional regulator with GAF, ATPase, and Fis domain
MLDIPSRELFTTLASAARAIAPTTMGVGISQAVDDGLSVTYQMPEGFGRYIMPASDVPEVLHPHSGAPRHAVNNLTGSKPDGALEWSLQIAGVQRLVSLPIPDVEPLTCMWVGYTDPLPPTSEQLQEFERIARDASALLHIPPSADERAERARRLECASALLPEILHVLDVRDVFDRLSHISKDALPHDLLTLGTFISDDLSRMVMYAQNRVADGPFVQGQEVPQPYHPAAIRSWDFDIVDDRQRHPLEVDRLPTKIGMTVCVRVPFTFDGKIIGGLGFHKKDPTHYTSLDVIVARRLADYVAVALSHHFLAERLAAESRRGEELRARAAKSDLLDEVLASITGTGDLPEVFDRVSDAAQRVLQHDALVLTSVMSDRRHAKVYASKTPLHASFPELVEVPPYQQAHPDWEFQVVEDLQADPEQAHLTTTRKGYRAALRVPIRFDNEYVAALSFLSFDEGHYTAVDVPIARRIADRVALSFARERGRALTRKFDEATERAAKLEARVRALTDELDARTGYRRVVGESKEWRQVLTQATQVASTETTVLLLGESGTGKEVVARFLHRASSRDGGPFIALNCAALPEQLLEAELFGYERGAYTGATQSKPGQLEQAAGGTLFLDEVGEMSPSAQAKFLRVLQEREFQRLGGTRILRTDARIIAATNRDLPRAIKQGQFREDLYYRLNVFAIHLPPLRDRKEDVLPLSNAFVAEIGRGLGRPPAGISKDARQMLIDYPWPGNVRELRNILERAAILCDGGLITSEYLALTPHAHALTPAAPPAPPAAAVMVAGAGAGAGAAFARHGEHAAAAAAAGAGVGAGAAAPGAPMRPASAGDLQSMERTMIADALQQARFNKSKAAKALGLTRHQLYLRLQKYGLE